MKFDPDKAFVKVRGMNGVHYEQDGHKFSAGYEHLGKLNAKKPAPDDDDDKSDVRERARAKIAKKKKASKKKAGKGNLDGFKDKEAPDAVSSAVKEDEAARRAEEHA